MNWIGTGRFSVTPPSWGPIAEDWLETPDGFREAGICDGTATAGCDAYISGNEAALGTSWTWPVGDTPYVNLESDTVTSNKRSDIGFRCLIQIDSDNSANKYAEDE